MRGDIPFTKIVKAIPREMRNKTPPAYISLLEPKVSCFGTMTGSYLLWADCPENREPL